MAQKADAKRTAVGCLLLFVCVGAVGAAIATRGTSHPVRSEQSTAPHPAAAPSVEPSEEVIKQEEVEAFKSWAHGTLKQLHAGNTGRKECRMLDGVDVCMRVDVTTEKVRLSPGIYEVNFLQRAPASAQFIVRNVPGAIDWPRQSDCTTMDRRVTQHETWEGCEFVLGPFKGGLLTLWRHRLNKDSVLTITMPGFRKSGLQMAKQAEKPQP